LKSLEGHLANLIKLLKICNLTAKSSEAFTYLFMPLIHQLLPYFLVPHTQVNSFLMQQSVQDPSMGDIDIFCTFTRQEPSLDIVEETSSSMQCQLRKF
jgi:hypothetical protein